MLAQNTPAFINKENYGKKNKKKSVVNTKKNKVKQSSKKVK